MYGTKKYPNRKAPYQRELAGVTMATERVSSLTHLEDSSRGNIIT